MSHTPVLLQETIDNLQIKSAGCYIDCTFGAGGHSRAILNQLDSDGRLFALDKDGAVIRQGREDFASDGRVSLHHASFAKLAEIVDAHELRGKISGILFDLGVSSMQLDEANRGFSFQRDGPLDMRMDNSSGITAAKWLATAKEQDLARVIKEYGEERYARRIARQIVKERTREPIQTTRQLAVVVASACPTREHHKHPATRTFQALRIKINCEMAEIDAALEQAVCVLAPEARLLVISFHGLEHRLVKQFFKKMSHPEVRSHRYSLAAPLSLNTHPKKLKVVGKAIKPGRDEVRRNPRCRSALLRVAERLAA